MAFITGDVHLKKTIPHSYASIRVEADGILDLQRRLKEDKDQFVSINDFIVKASALALRVRALHQILAGSSSNQRPVH